MSLENFLSFLQQLITMTDPDDAASVALAENALTAVIALAHTSKTVDPLTARAMHKAHMRLNGFLRHKDEFAGKPGDYMGNQHKRYRLRSMLSPEC